LKNFEYREIPFGSWRRLNGTTPRGDDSARPHIVGLTDKARSFISMDAFGAMGTTGLCPGEILVDGAWEPAYRFVELTPEVAAKMLPDLEAELARVTEVSP